MIKIKPHFDNPPDELWQDASRNLKKHKRTNPNGQSRIEQMIEQGNKHIFDNKVYGSDAVKHQLKVIFHEKCGYCETVEQAVAHKDIDHFRPKIIYYWLAYEWTNLLQACQICNRDGKRTEFPIKPNINRAKIPLNAHKQLNINECHILNSVSLNAEQPLLLHPAIDDPQQHLRFLPNGQVEGLTEKGKKSIVVYGLDRDKLQNARAELVKKWRKDIWEEYEFNIPDFQRISIEIAKVIKNIVAHIENPKSPYIGFAITVFENFEEFIIDNTNVDTIDLPDKDIMRQAARAILKT